jgi:hypothetical protein
VGDMEKAEAKEDLKICGFENLKITDYGNDSQ